MDRIPYSIKRLASFRNLIHIMPFTLLQAVRFSEISAFPDKKKPNLKNSDSVISRKSGADERS